MNSCLYIFLKKIRNPSKYIQNSMNFELDAPTSLRASSYGHVLSLVDGRGRHIGRESMGLWRVNS